MNTLHLTTFNLAMATLLILFVGLLSVALRLGIGKRLFVAALRTVVQLSALGFVLGWIFDGRRWFVILALLVAMVLNASIAAVQRTARRTKGLYADGVVAITISSVITMSLVLSVVVEVRPWYEARYVIPLVGITLAHSLTGLSLCLDHLLQAVDEKGAQVESFLALGATRWEAVRPMVQDAVRTGLIPIVNAMTVAGIVSIPGMMTGQILAGEPPQEAVKYQIVVMFMVASASGIAAIVGAGLTARHLLNRRHQLEKHRIFKP